MCFALSCNAFPARTDNAFDLPQCIGTGLAFQEHHSLLHDKSSSGEALLRAAGTAFSMKDLILSADVIIMSFSTCAAVCRSCDGEAAAAAPSSGRRFMEFAFAAMRAYI